MSATPNGSIAEDTLKRMGQVVRGWQLHRCVDLTFADLAPDDQSGYPGRDALLRGVLPDSAQQLPQTHQHLSAALDPPEIQTVPVHPRGTTSVGPCRCALARTLRPLGLDHTSAADQDGKSRVTGDCHARF